MGLRPSLLITSFAGPGVSVAVLASGVNRKEDRSMNSPRRAARLFVAFLAITMLLAVAGVAWAAATTIH
jgi:hypothetical protein